MDIKDSLRKLDVTLYGNLESISDTLSKCRVRIFYKGLNRNRTFISESFANQLIESLPYAPIKGIFDKEEIDFDDHGEKNSDGKIYGVIAEDPHFAWEPHVDKDGVERIYACADVILYTALYPEANLVCGKSQSMEIHKKGLEGEWKLWHEDGQPYFEFQKGHLLGLQILGNEVEPCFEGSAFFSLYKDAKDLYDYIKNFSKKEESISMENNEVMNSTEVEESVIENSTVEEVAETTEQSVNYEELKSQIEDYKAQIESLTTDKNSLTAQLEKVQAELDNYKNNETEETEEEVETNNELSDEVKSEIESYKNTIAEKENEIARLNQLNSDITNEKSELEAYKKSIETETKKSIIDEFSIHLTEEQIADFTSKIDEYSVKDFKKEVCFAAYNTDNTMFSNAETKEEPNLIYKNENKTTLTGALALLNKHKGGNR